MAVSLLRVKAEAFFRYHHSHLQERMKASRNLPLEPRKQPRQARAVATVSAVLEGAAQVLESEGFEKMTTTRVAERAGTSVGTLYQYFPSKEALLVAVVEARMAATDRALSTVFDVPASAPLAEHVRVMISALIAEKKRRPRLNAELVRQAPRLEKMRLIARTLDRAHGMVRTLLEAHQDETSVTDPDLSAWLVVHAVNGMVDGAILGPPKRLADPRLTDAIVAHVLGSVGAKAPQRKVRQERRAGAQSGRPLP
jgi:AcrR family transcriptional regulator